MYVDFVLGISSFKLSAACHNTMNNWESGLGNLCHKICQQVLRISQSSSKLAHFTKKVIKRAGEQEKQVETVLLLFNPLRPGGT